MVNKMDLGTVFKKCELNRNAGRFAILCLLTSATFQATEVAYASFLCLFF